MTKHQIVGTIAFVICAMAVTTWLNDWNFILKAVAGIIAGTAGSVIIRVLMKGD